jgi:hypothetical protein
MHCSHDWKSKSIKPMNNHGGKRQGAGRKPGALGRVTADIRALAQPYGADAVAELARLGGLTKAPGAANEATRVAALRELLDRGYGRATQQIVGDGDGSPVHYVFEWASAAPAEPPSTAPVIDAEPRQPETLELVWARDEA